MLARSYEASSWTRLVHAVQLVDAIWRDDVETVRELVTRNPDLLHETRLIRKDSNWGPPMTYAANLGRDRIIAMLHGLGATDLESALGRAALQGKVDTARMLHAMLGKPPPPNGALGGPAYTLSVDGHRVRSSRSARRVARRRRADRSRRWTSSSRPTAATRRPSTRSSRCTRSTASNCPTRRRWRCIAGGSICSRRISSAIPIC